MKILLFVVLLFGSSLELLARPHVVFINPGSSENDGTGPFWQYVSRFAVAAAEDLDLKLTILYANRHHLFMKELVHKAVALKPDYLILVNEKGVGGQLLRMLTGTDIQVFFLLNYLSKPELDRLGEAHLQRIIGSVEPNNFQAGKQLALSLLQLGLSSSQQSPLSLYALLGDYRTVAALERQRGLQSATAKYPNRINVLDERVAYWSYSESYQLTKAVLSKGYAVDLIWAANDTMGFGAKAAAKDLGLSVLVGGINWELQEEDTALDISIGGHMALSAEALVYIAMFEQGLVTSEKHWQSDIFQSLDTQSSKALMKMIEQIQLRSIDFKRFLVPQENRPAFTIDNLVRFAER